MTDSHRDVFVYNQASIDLGLTAALLPEFKNHARIDYANDDLLIETYLGSSISFIEQVSGCHIHSRVLEIDILPGYYSPPGYFSLPVTPVTAATDSIGQPIKIYNRDSSNLIPLFNQLVNNPSYPITCTTGYDILTIPPQLKLAIFRYASYLYENRESFLEVSLASCPDWWAECMSSNYVARC